MDPKILKGVGAKIVILTFYDQVVKVGSGWVEQEFVLIIIARLSNGTRLPNELLSYWIVHHAMPLQRPFGAV